MTSVPCLVRARWTDLDQITGLIADTTLLTPSATWLVPAPDRRRTVLAAVARIWAEHALLFGEVHLLPDGTGAAVWMHRYRPLPLPVDFLARLTTTCGDHVERFRLLDGVLSLHRPVTAHNHLAFLAVPSPPGRSIRIGQLLAGSHRRMATLGLPMYAETCDEALLARYHRHGYAVGGSFRLPDGSVLWQLWRRAGAGGPAGDVRRPQRR
ncbi:hypothetical protein AB0H57_10070 [Micromonospora sp. NPDC050686]|uniref:hypothetical protein n=1 Tax=Micromonospora sp. NPDC050686 TaxID=3154631 RepID=UPI0033CDB238